MHGHLVLPPRVYNGRCASGAATTLSFLLLLASAFLFLERLFSNQKEMFSFVNKLIEATCRWIFKISVYLTNDQEKWHRLHL